MNISQLEYYVTTVKYGSVSEASRNLYVSHQAVSKGISELEKELGLKLLVREAKGVVPTTFGIAFAEKARNALDAVAELKVSSRMDSCVPKEQVELSVAVASSSYRGSAIEVSAIHDFRKQHSGVDLVVISNSSSVCLAALVEGVVGSAVLLGPVDECKLAARKVGAARLHVIMSVSHPLRSLEKVTIADLSDEYIALPRDLRYCYRAITARFSAFGITPKYIEVKQSISAHCEFINEKNGIVFVFPDSVTRFLYHGALMKPLMENNAIAIPIYFAYKEGYWSPIIESMANYLLKSFD